MSKNSRIVFWVCFLTAVFLIVWYCFAFYGVAAQVESASDCGLVVAALFTFLVANVSDKTKRTIERYLVGGDDDA